MVEIGILTSMLYTLLLMSLNAERVIEGIPASGGDLLLSMAYLGMWLALGCIMGRTRSRRFLGFTATFWASGFGLAAFRINEDNPYCPLNMIQLTFLAPLNGITYLEGFRTLNSFGFLALCTITPVLCTGMGYGLGAISCTARFTASMNSRQLTAVLK